MKNLLTIILLFILSFPVWAQEAVQNQANVQEKVLDPRQVREEIIKSSGSYSFFETDELNYTLGPNDVIEINLLGHPELSGKYTLNSEGKIQYEFAGELMLGGMTKKKAEETIKEAAAVYVVSPRLIFNITQYNSKFVYVIGQVSKPGKYHMRSEVISVMEAIIEAGMPLPGSAMHRARLITPSKVENQEAQIKIVDLNVLLQKGDLKNNYEMHSGDQLYVPTTQEEMDYIQAKNENSPISNQVVSQTNVPKASSEEVRYTLGADDVIKITVQKHPEISGSYTVNQEGKIQVEMVGDIQVAGMTKKELEGKFARLISSYIDSPDVSITILEYRSKVYYVIGEVGRPGKYYMRSESIPIREAVIEAGLPTLAAAMRKSNLIIPAKNGKKITKKVDLYAVLYGGNLDKNVEMHPGDFLYIPSTVMAKVFRVIAPVTEPVTSAAEAQSGINTLGTPTVPAK